MDEQAGAPPDDFAVSGQNWGFPTYNWEIMAKDNFTWWQNRMHKLSEYFDALRIDHILGFFRIWQIPTQHIDGTMGLFNPRLPYSLHELEIYGLRYMVERFCKPYIRGHFLRELFAENTEWVINEFLNEVIPNEYNLKDFCNSQVKIKNLFLNNKKYASMEHVEQGLSHLVTEVLFIEEPGSNNTAFNPRITLFKTRSFEELDEFNQHAITKLYNDYFFRRHDEFWKKQALWKLPALLNATNMLICGEDLGMIPNGVPDVMRDLNIISLEIQRMPKENQTFGDTRQYPYMSVCSPSCHDMSTVRGWWEADYALTQLYYKEVLGQDGIAPRYCTPEIVESIIRKHLDAPSMWAIFPIQDLLGMNETLRRKDAASEQINDPSNPQHYWRYRFHIPLEELSKHKEFSHKVKRLVRQSGR
jgi:4-alpha-glucanotransferase